VPQGHTELKTQRGRRQQGSCRARLEQLRQSIITDGWQRPVRWKTPTSRTG